MTTLRLNSTQLISILNTIPVLVLEENRELAHVCDALLDFDERIAKVSLTRPVRMTVSRRYRHRYQSAASFTGLVLHFDTDADAVAFRLTHSAILEQ